MDESGRMEHQRSGSRSAGGVPQQHVHKSGSAQYLLLDPDFGQDDRDKHRRRKIHFLSVQQLYILSVAVPRYSVCVCQGNDHQYRRTRSKIHHAARSRGGIILGDGRKRDAPRIGCHNGKQGFDDCFGCRGKPGLCTGNRAIRMA